MTLIAQSISNQLPNLSAYLPQVFKAYPDLMGYEGTHPLIHQYVFEDRGAAEKTSLLQEIQWVLEGLQIFSIQDIEDFIIELKGLRLTVEGYQLKTWEEVIMAFDAEKKAFLPIIRE